MYILVRVNLSTECFSAFFDQNFHFTRILRNTQTSPRKSCFHEYFRVMDEDPEEGESEIALVVVRDGERVSLGSLQTILAGSSTLSSKRENTTIL